MRATPWAAEMTTERATGAIGPAVIEGWGGATDVLVRLADGERRRATLALSAPYAPRPGDRVLVARNGAEAWVIGVLSALRPAGTAPVLAQRDGRTELVVPAGDLHLRAERGRIRLEAADGIDLDCERDLRVRSAELHLRSDRAEVDLDELSASAQRVQLVADTVVRTVDVLETRAGRVIERAREVYREVQGLSQTRAGRVRVLCSDVFHLLAGRGQIRARDELSLDGEQIRLG